MGRKKQGWSAWGLPYIIEKMASSQEQLVELWNQAIEDEAVSREEAAEIVRVMRRAWQSIDGVDLSWIDRKLCDVIAQTATTIPRWSPAAAQPARKGFLAWEKPLLQVPMTGHV